MRHQPRINTPPDVKSFKNTLREERGEKRRSKERKESKKGREEERGREEGKNLRFKCDMYSYRLRVLTVPINRQKNNKILTENKTHFCQLFCRLTGEGGIRKALIPVSPILQTHEGGSRKALTPISSHSFHGGLSDDTTHSSGRLTFHP